MMVMLARTVCSTSFLLLCVVCGISDNDTQHMSTACYIVVQSLPMAIIKMQLQHTKMELFEHKDTVLRVYKLD